MGIKLDNCETKKTKDSSHKKQWNNKILGVAIKEIKIETKQITLR